MFRQALQNTYSARSDQAYPQASAAARLGFAITRYAESLPSQHGLPFLRDEKGEFLASQWYQALVPLLDCSRL